MIKNLIKKEIARQKKSLSLIPSENYVPKAIRAVLATELVNKYAEGYPGKKYYNGNEVIDAIENEVKSLALKAFKLDPEKWGANVQPHSGSPANLAAYTGTLQLGDRIMGMSLADGGHLTHGSPVSLTSKLFKFRHFGVDEKGFLDYDDILRIAREFKPQLIVCGFTAYPREVDFKRFRKIADEVGAKLMADISHIAGLVVGGAHQSPFPYADVVTFTTHKTLRGPRGAIIIAKKELITGIDKALFPGMQGGPHMHTIAAIGMTLEEAMKPAFKKYAGQIVKNAKALAGEFMRLGMSVSTGGTDNHLLLVDMTPFGMTGGQAADLLERHGLVVNKNMIPHDPRKPWDPSGIRLGTPAATTRGMKEKDMIKLARKIQGILSKKK